MEDGNYGVLLKVLHFLGSNVNFRPIIFRSRKNGQRRETGSGGLWSPVDIQRRGVQSGWPVPVHTTNRQ